MPPPSPSPIRALEIVLPSFAFYTSTRHNNTTPLQQTCRKTSDIQKILAFWIALKDKASNNFNWFVIKGFLLKILCSEVSCMSFTSAYSKKPTVLKYVTFYIT